MSCASAGNPAKEIRTKADERQLNSRLSAITDCLTNTPKTLVALLSIDYLTQ